MNQKDFYDSNAEEYALSQKNPRLIIHKTKTYLPLDLKGKDVLDLGCGNGELLNYLKEFNSYLGVDYSEMLVKDANKQYQGTNIKFMQGDIRKRLPIFEKYDLIILNDIIHHTNFNVIGYAKEYLKPNGKIIISEPILKDCLGKNFGWVWFNKPIKENNAKPILLTKYQKEHPPDYEFSINEIKKVINDFGLEVIKERSSQYNVIPFINRINNYWLVRFNLELEQILIGLNPRLRLNGSRYTCMVKIKNE